MLMTADEIRLLLRLARGDTAGIARCLDTRVASLDQLAEAAAAEGLAVVLLRALANLPPGVEMATQHLEALHARRRRQEVRSTILVDALAGLADRFSGAGQAFVLLKGPYLAARYYGAITGRDFVDLDLLVPSGDRSRASRLLESAGYGRRSRVIGGETITSVFVHGFDFVAGDANLDLHWCLSRHPSLRLNEPRMWDLRRAYPIAGRTYAVLSEEHEVVFEALSLLRDIERGRPKAKNVIDLVQVAAASDAGFDWYALLERSRGDGTFGPLVNVLSLCLDVADAHDLAPRLSATLARHADRRVPGRPSGSPCGFRPTPWDFGNKCWSARVHDTTPLAWFLWWGASLPFRMAVHRRGPTRPTPGSS